MTVDEFLALTEPTSHNRAVWSYPEAQQFQLTGVAAGKHHFERDFSVERQVACPVHDSHAATTKCFEYLVAGDGGKGAALILVAFHGHPLRGSARPYQSYQNFHHGFFLAGRLRSIISSSLARAASMV